MSKALNVLGMMSGTSLDGLDLCAVRFEEVESKITYRILAAETLAFTSFWTDQLQKAAQQSAIDLLALHASFGRWLGEEAKRFMHRHGLSIDLVSSHGHTIFHQPNKGLSFQLGDGQHLAAAAGLEVVADFRQLDVAMGGQGAPLMPLPDKLLFPEYSRFLNLGGIANLSIQKSDATLGYDICAFNQVFNHYANKLGKPYDEGGKIAASGQVHFSLVKELDQLPYFQKEGPKSLGREEVEAWYLPLLNSLSEQDALATMAQHAINQLSKVLGSAEPILVTGGGAYNQHVLNNLRGVIAHVPTPEVVEFKEALGFALLGWLRYHGRTGALSTVTGAEKDHLAGVLFRA